MGILEDKFNIRKLNTYINGGSLYFSTIHPFSLDEMTMIRAEKIDVVISFMEEVFKPNWYNQAIRSIPNARHYYYTIKTPENLERLFDIVYSTIFNTLENGQNILLQCRSEYRYCITFFIAFLLRSFRDAQYYTVFNFISFIPKTKTNYTDSIINFLENEYGFLNIHETIPYNVINQLLLYENHVFFQPKKMFKYFKFF